uniref:CENP-V/GFA domain-containing protein n=1 Tax=Arion vulgaris TaxID=1028688 RepID=A0A0B6ZJX9_9EUPU
MTSEENSNKTEGEEQTPVKLVEITGGCHCGAVRYKAKTIEDVVLCDCNCSICAKKRLNGFVVRKEDFILLQGADNITIYTFNTGQAKHMFCKTCGVQSFYIPRSDPEGYSIMINCVDPGTVKSATKEAFDGRNWEQAVLTKHF